MAHHPTITIHIDKTRYEVEARVWHVRDLRNLAGIPEQRPFFLEQHSAGGSTELASEGEIRVEPGMHFSSRHRPLGERR